ncbi:MAG: glycosyl hydrolase, partial [Ignavibacteriaceae bacterium]
MNVVTRFIICSFFLLIASNAISAQENDKDTLFSDKTFSGLKLRSIGPALMSGRIADIAINPGDPSQWYVAVGSGGVWKTNNAGNTWQPIFDDQSSYSIGCVTLDPQNPFVVWVGTGENVGGRHVGYGDGIYRSKDGGESWENMGLKESQHISKIIVHPENSDILWAAVQGPLWSKGGERGLYKTTDAGTTWEKVLGDDEWIGVTDIIIDPRNPDQLYAATWQRHRNVASYLGGGP